MFKRAVSFVERIQTSFSRRKGGVSSFCFSKANSVLDCGVSIRQPRHCDARIGKGK